MCLCIGFNPCFQVIECFKNDNSAFCFPIDNQKLIKYDKLEKPMISAHSRGGSI